MMIQAKNTSFKTRRTQKTTSAVEALWKTILRCYLYLLGTFHKVVRLGINPMIQPESEDLPKDNPKLEIAVLRMKRTGMDKGSKERSPPHNLRQKPGQYICCQNHKLIADIENDIMPRSTKTKMPLIESRAKRLSKSVFRTHSISKLVEHSSSLQAVNKRGKSQSGVAEIILIARKPVPEWFHKDEIFLQWRLNRLADQASVFMARSVQGQLHLRQEWELLIPPSYSNAEDNSHKVVRLGINPMIQPEPEDLPKDNPKLEIAVLSHNEDEILLESAFKQALVKTVVTVSQSQSRFNLPPVHALSTKHNMRMLVKDTRSQDGIDVKDNVKGSKSRSQSMKEQAYNKEQREGPRPHELNDKSNLIDLMKECHQ
ncbi:hypothetical protein Tco_0657071 [Tanacetum coccineum]|uniref:Uncharacterized protein n=1 Tax=Tanacetum coccineum TaxID=301880 RepID=A0ABQ4XB67_9ASTR